MATLKKNVAANFISNQVIGLMNLLFIPLYIHFMGIESYGLVGFFSVLLSFFALLDLGLGATLNREMARLGAKNDKIAVMRDLLRTLEIPYWIVALFIGLVATLFSPALAYHWFQLKNLSPTVVEKAVLYMGLAIAFQWPLSFYSGGLMGRDRQVLLAWLNAVMAVCRGLGAVLVLWLVSPTVQAFFTWQILVSGAHTGLAALLLWSVLPKPRHRPKFKKALLKEVWRFAAGVTGINFLSFVLTQMDKIILSRMLSLEILGYYTLAGTVANYLFRLIGPVFSSAFPMLTHLYELRKEGELAKLYHKSCQLISVLTLPAALVLCFFSPEILLLWTRNPATVENAHWLVSVLVIGTAFNGLMNIPYALQLASGWTKLNFFVNLVSVFILVPSTIFLTLKYGAVGAASNWVIVNGAYIFITIPIMHRRLLKKEMGTWYGTDVLLPLVGALAVVAAGRWALPLDQLGFIPRIVCLGGVLGLATVTAGILAPATRLVGFQILSKWGNR